MKWKKSKSFAWIDALILFASYYIYNKFRFCWWCGRQMYACVCWVLISKFLSTHGDQFFLFFFFFFLFLFCSFHLQFHWLYKVLTRYVPCIVIMIYWMVVGFTSFFLPLTSSAGFETLLLKNVRIKTHKSWKVNKYILDRRYRAREFWFNF